MLLKRLTPRFCMILVLVSITGQFPPGMAILRSTGYSTSARPIIVVTAITSVAVAFFGGITIVIAFLATAPGMSFLGLGSAFWGAIIGLAAYLVLHRDWRGKSSAAISIGSSMAIPLRQTTRMDGGPAQGLP